MLAKTRGSDETTASAQRARSSVATQKPERSLAGGLCVASADVVWALSVALVTTAVFMLAGWVTGPRQGQ